MAREEVDLHRYNYYYLRFISTLTIYLPSLILLSVSQSAWRIFLRLTTHDYYYYYYYNYYNYYNHYHYYTSITISLSYSLVYLVSDFVFLFLILVLFYTLTHVHAVSHAKDRFLLSLSFKTDLLLLLIITIASELIPFREKEDSVGRGRSSALGQFNAYPVRLSWIFYFSLSCAQVRLFNHFKPIVKSTIILPRSCSQVIVVN